MGNVGERLDARDGGGFDVEEYKAAIQAVLPNLFGGSPTEKLVPRDTKAAIRSIAHLSLRKAGDKSELPLL